VWVWGAGCGVWRRCPECDGVRCALGLGAARVHDSERSGLPGQSAGAAGPGCCDVNAVPAPPAAPQHIQEMEKEFGAHEGCRLFGSVEVRRVAGRVHFSVHQSGLFDLLPQVRPLGLWPLGCPAARWAAVRCGTAAVCPVPRPCCGAPAPLLRRARAPLARPLRAPLAAALAEACAAALRPADADGPPGAAHPQHEPRGAQALLRARVPWPGQPSGW
jgi:hypothetical protein